MLQIVQTVFSGVTAVTVLIGGFKLYYVLKEHVPHTHTEKHRGQALTTDGILYPRGTARRVSS